MSELLGEIRNDLKNADKEYRHAYVDEVLNARIATQIKVLREQRNMRQEDLADACGIHQPMISRYENVDYSSWSTNTLKKLAFALDVVLEVTFKSFGDRARDVNEFSRESLQVPKFEDDPFFKESENYEQETNVAAAKQESEKEAGLAQGKVIPIDKRIGKTILVENNGKVSEKEMNNSAGDYVPELQLQQAGGG
jgi:transcriptional regulator with XRE-family HTH domain